MSGTSWTTAPLQAGGIDVPIYPTMTAGGLRLHPQPQRERRFCFVSNAELHAKVSSILDQVPSLEAVFTFEKVNGARHWSEVLEAGKSGTEHQSTLDSRRDAVLETDMATIIYTSGTTGRPKGVMLTHKNIAQNARLSGLPPVAGSAIPERSTASSASCPCCHIFERMLHYLYMQRREPSSTSARAWRP